MHGLLDGELFVKERLRDFIGLITLHFNMFFTVKDRTVTR